MALTSMLDAKHGVRYLPINSPAKTMRDPQHAHGSAEVNAQLEAALVHRLDTLGKTARMWGSPQELEAVAEHFFHLLWSIGREGWTWDDTLARWTSLGGPFAADDAEHAAMRRALWGAHEDQARAQVVQGFVVVWAGLERDVERERAAGGWLETLLDAPALAHSADRLNMVLFALMGFIAADPKKFVQALGLERHRIGGHELRSLCVVGPRGPSDAALTYTRNFTSWLEVTAGIDAMRERYGAVGLP
jgi:hypothetical protein